MDYDLMTTADVAALTRTPAETVRWWRYAGTGPRSFKIGRKVMYQRADVVAWLEERINADAPQGAA